MDGTSGPVKAMLRDSPGMAAQAHTKNPKLGLIADRHGKGRCAMTVALLVTHPTRGDNIYFPGASLGLLCFL